MSQLNEDEKLPCCSECGEYLHLNTKQQYLCLNTLCSLFRETPAWVLDTPYAVIRAGLTAKLAEVTKCPP